MKTHYPRRLFTHRSTALFLISALACGSLARGKERPAPVEIFDAVAVGDLAKATDLLKHNRKLVSIKDAHLGETPLHWAVGLGKREIVELLLANGADANAKGLEGETPLHVAAASGQKDIAALLLAANALVDVPDQTAQTPLLSAVGEAVDENGRTVSLGYWGGFPLNWHRAHPTAREGTVETAELLLAHRANVNAKDSSGQTALFMATVMGNPSMVQLLLVHGAEADINAKPTDSSSCHGTPLYWAAARGNKKLVELLLAHKADVNAGTPLAATDNAEVAELLLAHGADINARDGGGDPLHVAAQLGRLEVAELLLARGAALNGTADPWGRTPLGVAACWGHKDIVELLLAKGADVNATDKNGKTPLVGCTGIHADIAGLLQQHGGHE